MTLIVCIEEVGGAYSVVFPLKVKPQKMYVQNRAVKQGSRSDQSFGF